MTRIVINTTDLPTLRSNAKPGSIITLRIGVESVSAELVEVTALGDAEPKVIAGESSLSAVVLSARIEERS